MTASTTATVRQGRVRGVHRDDHIVWRGIPYAKPPVGEFRWRAPRPAEPWRGVLDAVAHGPSALQAAAEFGAEDKPLPGSGEDCLYLNVCAPAAPAPPEGRPVLLWLHAGGYLTGSGQQMGDGEAFARAGIVVVTVNYRLGALGFVHWGGPFGEPEADAGVCGLLDQIAALRWVRENIAAFGGDPGRVTLYGLSAGAKSVANLMASPAGRGLFHRAISCSGGADHVATEEAGTSLARGLLEELGCADPDAARAVPAEEVLAAQTRLAGGLPAVWLWRPTVHPRVLPTVPIERIAGGSAAGVPLLVGAGGNEAVSFAVFYGSEVVTAPAPGVLRGILGDERYQRALATYRESRGLTSDTAALLAAMGDERYGVPTLRLADAQSRHAPVHRYRVDVAAPGYPALMHGGHGTDGAMPWLYSQDLPDPERVAPDRWRTARRMHQAWASFVRGEAPAADGLPDWPAYDTEDRPVMIFGLESRVEYDPRRTERLVWDGATWPSGTWFRPDTPD